MVINVSGHPWRSKKEYDEMRYPVDEDLFSVATAEYEGDREMEWEDEVAGTVGTLGENNEFYYETLIEFSGMKKEPNTKTGSMLTKACESGVGSQMILIETQGIGGEMRCGWYGQRV